MLHVRISLLLIIAISAVSCWPFFFNSDIEQTKPDKVNVNFEKLTEDESDYESNDDNTDVFENESFFQIANRKTHELAKKK